MAKSPRMFLTLTILLIWSGLVVGLTPTLQQVTNFGTNPTNVGMFVYKPTTVTAKPAVIVAVHYCGGTVHAYFSGSPYAQSADTYGFIVIYPNSPNSGGCWDVSSQATLTHNGGGDSNGIASMVSYAIATYGAKPSRILSPEHPLELWSGATVYSGVAAGCFFSNFGGVNAWNSEPNSSCSEGEVSATSAQWASIVRAMYPSYTGDYPPIQEYHGTIDTTLLPENLGEEIKERTGILGHNAAAPTQGILATNVGHTVPIQGDEDLKWFGFIPGGAGGAPAGSSPGGPTSSTGATTTTTPTTPPTSTPSSGTVAEFGQCGGIGWTGATALHRPQCVCEEYTRRIDRCPREYFVIGNIDLV
ncbi:carbohydrate esterase family 1 and carbohydrate-binding module family 1 protein [Mycena metata]|uniref:Carbohydrate esterase family 1 and carbohydrate-binding module family 1 protein n=1 Tax=Mycena metata TaxID=1033252 RepID=A0AAD7MM27_9AGAR|nr:carbohydrate esterase family 1 and carbohydrate-binding module family 1 protein [Mycena metata]